MNATNVSCIRDLFDNFVITIYFTREGVMEENTQDLKLTQPLLSRMARY